MIYDDIESYYSNLNKYIENNYKVIESKFPYIKLAKDNNIIELDLNIDRPNICNVEYPDYNNSLLNVINLFKENYTEFSTYTKDSNIFDKKYKNTIILILDGMGKNILDEFSNRYCDNFLSKNIYKYIISIYPSTTACATTSIKSGLLPYETSWTGWSNYFTEVNRELILFMGIDYYTEEKGFITAYDIIPYKPYFNNLNVLGGIVEPEFGNKEYRFENTLDKTLSKLDKGYQTLYVYDTEPDGLLHQFGTKSDKVYSKLNQYSKSIEKFYKKLPKDTLLIISADHGHIDSCNIKFYLDKYLYSLLERNPSNDARCITFKVKVERKEEFKNYFNSIYSNIYTLYSKDEFIEKGFIGKSNIKGKKLDDFLADFIAVAKTDYTLVLKESSLKLKSNHAGMTDKEMIIPLIVLKK